MRHKTRKTPSLRLILAVLAILLVLAVVAVKTESRSVVTQPHRIARNH